MYQISSHLVHRELRNATFEGEKIATSIKRPDSDPNHLCLSSIEATKIKKSASPAQGRMKAVDALIPTMAPS